MDPLRENLGAAEIREAIVCDGVTIVPRDLKGNERKIAKNLFAYQPRTVRRRSCGGGSPYGMVTGYPSADDNLYFD